MIRSSLGLLIVFSAAFAALAGCSTGGYYPVRGRVVDQQGQPIPGLETAQIIFSMVDGPSSSMGEIAADGSFSMFTERPGDGVPPGKYLVHIPRRYLDPERPAPQAVEGKYERPDTSGLEVTVEAKKNEFEFKVNAVPKRGA